MGFALFGATPVACGSGLNWLNERKKEPGLADILQAQAGTNYCSPSSEDFLRFEASGIEAAIPKQPAGMLRKPHPFGQ